jgi:uncharacterized membrane protein
MAPYVLQNFLSAGRTKLHLDTIPLSAVQVAEPEVKEIKDTAASLRLDSVISSGFRIGRSVVGTMTTTLLLAYSGGYITLLMMFSAQGTPVLEFLNSSLVASELVKTLIGSFSLVLVAPFTAVISGWIFGRR